MDAGGFVRRRGGRGAVAALGVVGLVVIGGAGSSMPVRTAAAVPVAGVGATRNDESPRGVTAARFVAPVADRIVERFDVSAGRFGPGNRGVDFDTPPGAPVAAIGDGTVTFAGPVAGIVWVTVQHPDGLRSTLGPMASLEVAAGRRVVRGERLGTAAGRLHLGIRAGDTYLDPEPLLGVTRRRARLVPVR